MQAIESLKQRWNDLHAYIPGKSIDQVASLNGLAPNQIVKLASNENPLGCSPLAKQAMLDLLNAPSSYQNQLAFYPEAMADSLCQALQTRYPETKGLFVAAGTGMDNMLEGLARLVLRPGREALIHIPTFEYYEIVTRWAQAKPVFHLTSPEDDFRLDLDSFCAKISSETDLVFLCNPNNPTGNQFTWPEIELVLKQASKHNSFVFLDEAYGEYSGESHLDRIHQHPNLIIGRTFSKIYGLAALRVGWMVMAAELEPLFRKVQTPFSLGLLSQVGAKASLLDEDFRLRSIALNAAGLKQIAEGLKELGLRSFSSTGNYISFLAGRPATEVSQYLLKRGIIVRDVSASRGAPYDLVRVSIGLEEQNSFFLSCLGELLQVRRS